MSFGNPNFNRRPYEGGRRSETRNRSSVFDRLSSPNRGQSNSQKRQNENSHYERRNQNESSSRNQGRGGGRMYPIGVKVMENILLKESYMIPVELLKRNSGYDILLNDPDLREFKLCLVIKLVGKSVSSRANDEGVIDLLLETFKNVNFCQKLMNLISEMKYNIKLADEYLPMIAAIIAEFLRLSPNNAYPLISNLVDICYGVIIHLKNEKVPCADRIEQIFENVQTLIKETRSKLITKTKNITSGGADPPDDFKDLPVIPTCDELNALERPFLRHNIIDGGYKNTDHYLDVQFRLLKEDFLRPLRLGLQEYRKSFKAAKNADVRIYTNVLVEATGIEQGDLVYYLKLDIRNKRFKIENSKRLMYGNILCISSDNFETMIAATIFSRDKLVNHVIAVKLETEPFHLDFKENYTMIESKAYFVSYKHTLKALQDIREVPLKDYIVHVNETNSPPDYLSRFTSYEYNIDKKLTIIVRDPVMYWPSSKELRLDESQRRALHGALTRQMAVIQGPPGTGKTYLGLLITKILLSNKETWNPQKGHPLLVVCYTNHALDQFLEGMLSFTTNLCRVGSRSQNEALAQYQINKLMYRSLKSPDNDMVDRMFYQMRMELKQLQNVINKISEMINLLKKPGIISFESFQGEFSGIIPPHFQRLINDATMRNFLSVNFIEDLETDENMHDTMEVEVQDDANDIDEEIRREEELERILDDDDDDDDDQIEIGSLIGTSDLSILPFFKFDATPEDISKLINTLNVQISEEPFNIKNRLFSERIDMLKLEQRAIKASENVAFTFEECKQLEAGIYVDELDFISRWKLYKFWKMQLGKKYQEKLSLLEKKHVKLTKSIMALKDVKYLNLMKNVDVVGMTTTGAAQYLIVEEAAEILEAHIVTSLSEACKHLILIGDHQQLRPKPNVYELALHYHMDTSFFERMIKNGIAYETLEYQHRMRPNISNLLVPTIYENLKDHESVFNYPEVRGVKENLFFIDHDIFEPQPLDDLESFENPHEAEFLMGLCRHFMFQGYSSSDVTIITPYLGQFRYVKQLQKKPEFHMCKEVRVSILDNYQGEESNIILLSLVRSNEEKKVGFMKIDNRVNVALSRAKHGMFIIGNMSQMAESSELWRKINKKLIDGCNIGPELQLVCFNHPLEMIKVTTLKDFIHKSPEGGCRLPCIATLPGCGHVCPRLCHTTEKDHSRVRCTQPCTKSLCDLGHECPKLCFQECEKCAVLIEKLLPCGHVHPVKCSVLPKDFKCPTIVKRELPFCKHVFDMECHVDVNTYKCTKRCIVRLDCGHQCKMLCHPRKDPNHEEYDCHEQCDKAPLNCELGHKCLKRCYESCGTCIVKVDKNLKCGHTLNKVQCGILEKDIVCPQKCRRILGCGHRCPLKCGATCGGCMVMVDKLIAECNHKAKVPCSVSPNKKFCLNSCVLQKAVGTYCSEVCGMPLDCGHSCKGKCGECLNGRLHSMCKENCNKTLVCGHVCSEPCSTDCPPCQKQCLWKCVHSECKKVCGIPCINCKEKCTRRCNHQYCVNKCGEPCSIDPCSEPCPKRLKCGHDCIGYCGEKCPKNCRFCDKEEIRGAGGLWSYY
ncbi:NFX1-type zinc finger-containing protein 1 [Armadillidium nasatum]|uniref:NFX1-type zinc finger-containing protein 1 n=1 Tax=Armadillidium nasatum TaxID=96803 RepID=A0A5N5SUH5_9CRUS|nr:NFX1-type zinc finger-containing protein 1 [Armadillidium nasatum]